jgi:hypothetical protein
VVVYPHPERIEDVPHPLQWEGVVFHACLVCGERLWWSSDEAGDMLRDYPA